MSQGVCVCSSKPHVNHIQPTATKSPNQQPTAVNTKHPLALTDVDTETQFLICYCARDLNFKITAGKKVIVTLKFTVGFSSCFVI